MTETIVNYSATPPEGISVNPALRAKNLYKIYGTHRGAEAVRRLQGGTSRDALKGLGTAAVIDANFDVAPGEIFVVMGLSGSGKSSLIRMLNGLVEPTAGAVEILGTDISQADAKTLRQVRQTKVSMVFQHFALLPHRTVLDNAAYPLQIQGIPLAEQRERAERALDLVGLSRWSDMLPAQLSGGMQQRVGLARALAAETDILLMDEAFSALDPLIRREMQEQLVELHSTLNKTIVFITHDLNEAMYLGDRIMVMRDGRTVQIGTAEDILTAPADDYVSQFVQDVDRTRVLSASSVMRAPRLTIPANIGPSAAVRIMRDRERSWAFVTGRRRKMLGYITTDEVVSAIRAGKTSIKTIIRPVSEVTPDTAMSDLFALAVESDVPLAVVDEQGRLVGAVHRANLLSAMTVENGNDPHTVAESLMEPLSSEEQQATEAPAPTATESGSESEAATGQDAPASELEAEAGSQVSSTEPDSTVDTPGVSSK